MSILKKLKSTAKNGVKPILNGIYYFKNYNQAVENSAKKRAEICKSCKHFADEPLPFLKVIDYRIPALSGKICNHCGCTLSYKLRQNKNLCNHIK